MAHFPTMHQRVVDELGQRIVDGAWEPGDPLPVEDTLAAEIGVSRGVLREAVKSLVAKGMLRVRPRTGTRVLPPEQWNHLDPDVLRWKQAGDAVALLRDTSELRRIVEPAAALGSCASTACTMARWPGSECSTAPGVWVLMTKLCSRAISTARPSEPRRRLPPASRRARWKAMSAST